MTNNIEEQLKDLMLQTVSFVLDGKTIRQGKITVFNTKQCFIKFKLEHNGDIKEWELPYPYKFRKTDNGYLFDYCLSAFVPRTEDSYWKMLLMNKSDASRMHNNWLYVYPLSA